MIEKGSDVGNDSMENGRIRLESALKLKETGNEYFKEAGELPSNNEKQMELYQNALDAYVQVGFSITTVSSTLNLGGLHSSYILWRIYERKFKGDRRTSNQFIVESYCNSPQNAST